jgi:hypothetical protein
VVIIISVSLGVAIALGSLVAARNGGSLTRTTMTLDEVMRVALWATFCALWIYSRSLGFTLRPRVRGIAMGFILFLTSSVVCLFVAMRFSLSTAMIANQVGTAAEFLTMTWWLGVFWGEEKFPQAVISTQVEKKLPQSAISAQVEEMPGQYGKTVEAVARML